MSVHDQLGLNRVTKPQIPLPEFLKFAADSGFQFVEVRNDFTEKGVLDGLSQADLDKAFKAAGVKCLSINAVYPFDSAAHLKENLAKLKGLIAESKKIANPAIVFCPLNDAADKRTSAQRAEELVAALDAYGPLLAEAKITGLIEPLGFEVCSLRTKKAALAGVAKSKYPQVYKLVHDTFHHYLAGETEFFPAETGLIHVSGVLAGKAKSAIVDDDRLLVTKDDIMDNKGQVATLLARGCKAPVSYEPFSPRVRATELPELKKQLKESVKFLLG